MKSYLHRFVLFFLSVVGLTSAVTIRAQSDYSHPYYWRTLAGVSPFGFRDGVGASAQFAHPYGIAVAPSGVIYVSDTTNCVIRKISAGGVVTTFAGQPGVPGFANGAGSAAQFAYPGGLAVVEADLRAGRGAYRNVRRVSQRY